jgi:hypothetical protein
MKSGVLAIVLILVTIVLGGCVTQQRQPVQMQTEFDYDMHKSYIGSGPNTIMGQGFLRQKGGGVVTCAGSQVLLMPATPYFREAIGHIRNGKKPQAKAIDPAYARQAQCDAQGNFVFSEIPNGTWFVVTEVKWSVGYSRQGGSLLQEVTVSGGKTTQVLLSEKDFVGW